MLSKALQNFNIVAKTTCSVLKSEKTLCGIKPIQTILKRNASIHTRNILIQKAKLEHIDNFGILLLVSQFVSAKLCVFLKYVIYLYTISRPFQ